MDSNKDFVIKELLVRKAFLETEITKIKNRLEQAPEGSLHVSKKKNAYQFYLRNNSKPLIEKYITNKDRSLAVSLAQKDYDTRLLKTLREQLKVIEGFLKSYDGSAPQQIFEKLSEARKQLVTPEFLSDEEFINRWQNTPYDRLGFGKDDPEYYTAKGERVRSKSEILIADALLRHNIPYRYEYPLYSHGVLIAAPDFNCLNVRLRKDYYWEHLGMMGNEDYSDRNVSKIAKYTLADDFDETSLILTMETDRKPLNTKVIEEKIRRYLL